MNSDPRFLNPDEWINYDGRWRELIKQIEEAGVPTRHYTDFSVAEVLENRWLYIWWHYYKRPTYSFVNPQAGSRHYINDLFDELDDKCKRIFVFYLDLLSEYKEK